MALSTSPKLTAQSERKSGGQAEHPGNTLEMSQVVDQVIACPVQCCCGCGSNLSDELVERVIVIGAICVSMFCAMPITCENWWALLNPCMNCKKALTLALWERARGQEL